MSSATQAPRRVPLDPAFAGLSSRRLTPDVLRQVRDTGMIPEGAVVQADGADFLPASSVTVYTPAQIRAAYGMFALPGTSSSVTSAQAAQMGAGQTIYLIDAQDDPNIAAELASFNSKFGLPGCTVTPISVTASLPLPAAPTTGCTFSIVYSNSNGVITATEPAYDAGWATEIAIDVQWAHATAPYARIILIEAPTGAGNSLNAAVLLADQMGPGIVSQSFGGPEGSYVVGYDAAYSTVNMTYLAATGDAGAAVNWPAVSSKVLAVGGTSLTYSGSGQRTEAVWSDTGGGVSAYIATPAYQALAVPGLGAPAMRAVADVAFNADTNTGQYIAVIAQNSSTVTYWDAGGTSLATPQWAGLIAVANALRAQTSLAPIGQAQPLLYGLGVQTASYGSAFLDITTGSDGSCATCSAGAGYDLPTGLGTPNAAALLAVLSGETPVAAPVVTSAAVSGSVGAALSFSITATGVHPISYSLLGAPTGMTVNASSGLVTWSTPVQGGYSVTASALDTVSGLSGQGTLTVSIENASAPQVQGGSINGIAQIPLTFTAEATGANLEFSLSGAPSGMSVNASGVISWSSPIVGTYSVTLIALDRATSLSGQGIYTVTIAAPAPPALSSESVTGTAGTAFTFCVSATATNPLTYSLTSAPSGMTIGTNGCIAWGAPTAGTFTVQVTVQDIVTGLSGAGVISLAVSPPGPGIGAGNLTAVAGQALTGSIAFTDSAATTLSITVSGMPQGLGFVVNGNLLNATWTSPVTGTYSLQVTVIDTQKLKTAATIPLTVTIQ